MNDLLVIFCFSWEEEANAGFSTPGYAIATLG